MRLECVVHLTLDRHAIIQEEVVVAFNLLQANLVPAANDVVQLTIGMLVQAVRHQLSLAVLAEVEPQAFVQVLRVLGILDAFQAVRVTEVVLLALDLLPATGVVIGAIVVHRTLSRLNPGTVRQLTGLLKLKVDAVDIHDAIGRLLGCGIEIVPGAVDFYPAAHQEAIHRISVCVDVLILEQAGVLGLANIDALVAEVVVVALDLCDAVGLLIINVVSVAILLFNPAVLHDLRLADQLAVHIEDVSANRQVTVRLPSVVGLVGNELTVHQHEVVILADLQQTILTASHAVDVVVEAVFLLYDALEHLAVRTEFVVANRQITVGFKGVVHLILDRHARVEEEVVIAIHLAQANLILAVNNVVQVTVGMRVQTIGHGLADAILAEVVPLLLVLGFLADNVLTAGQAIAVAEVVHLAVDLLPTGGVEARTVVILPARSFLDPHAADQLTGLLELEVDTVYIHSTIRRRIGRSVEVVPCAIDLLPAVHQQARLGVVVRLGFLVVEQTGQLGLADVDAISTKVVVVAIHLLDASVLLVIDVVRIPAILLIPAVLRTGDITDHLTIRTEGVGANGQVTPGLPGKVGLAGDQLTIHQHEVVVAVDLQQTVLTTGHTVDVIVEAVFLLNDALEHLAIRTELVIAAGQITIGLEGIVHLVLDRRTVVEEEVVVIFYLLQADLVRTIQDIVQIAVSMRVQAIGHGLADAVLAEVVPLALGCRFLTGNVLTTSDTIAILEEVLFTINGLPAIDIVAGAVVVAHTHRILDPHAVNQLTVALKGEFNTVNSHSAADCSLGFGIEVVPCTVDLLPAALQQATFRIVVHARQFILEQTRVPVHANVDAFGTEVVVVTFDLLDTIGLLIIDIVGVTVVIALLHPAILDDGSILDHLAIRAEGIGANRLVTPGLPSVVALVGNDLTIHQDEVVIVADLQQTVFTAADAVDVVVQTVVLPDKALQHLRVLAELVVAGGQVTMRFKGIIDLISDSHAVVQEEVVIAIHLLQTNLVHTFDDVIQVAVSMGVQSIGHGTADTVIAEVVPAHFAQHLLPGHQLAPVQTVAILEVIHVVTDTLPAFRIVAGTVIVTESIGHLIPDAADQATVLFKLVGNGAEELLAGCRCIGDRIEVVPGITNKHPVALHQAILGVAVCIDVLVHEEAGQLGLANVNARFTEVVEVTVNGLDAVVTRAIIVVGIAALFNDPAILQRTHQGVGIAELGVGILEVAAAIAGQIRVGVGIQAEGLLVLRLLREGVQTACTHVDGVADLAFVHRRQSILLVPGRILLGSQLDAIDDAQGVRGVHRDGLRHLDPVQRQGHRIGFLIHFDLIELEVVVNELDLRNVNIEVLVEGDLRLDLGHRADTLCQLQQEGPRGRAFHISAGQHVGQILQTCRNRDLRHIKCDGVGGHHVLINVLDVVDGVILGRGVGHDTIPCQHTIAAGRLVEVEAVLALLVQHHLNGGCHISILSKRRRDLHHLDFRLFHHDEVQAIHDAHGVVERKLDVIGNEGNFITFIACTQRQRNRGAINRIDLVLGKVQLIGNDRRHSCRAEHFITQHQRNFRLAELQRREDAVFGNGAQSFVRHCPGGTLRQIHFIAGCADTRCSHLHAGAHRQVIILTLNQRMVEGRGAGSSGNHDQRGGDGTCRTIGRTADNSKFFRTGPAGNEGGGTAAVQVDRLDTAGVAHDLSNFDHAAAAGEGLLTTIQNHEHNAARCRDTNSRTACTIQRVVSPGSHIDLAVLDQVRAEAGNAFLQLAGHSMIVRRAAKHRAAALGDAEEAAAVDRLVNLTMHQQQAAGFASSHVIAGAVNGGHDLEVGDVQFRGFVAVQCLGVVGLIQNARQSPAFGITASVVDHHVHVRAGNVAAGNVEYHLLVIRRSRVIDLHLNTGRQLIVFAVEHRQVGILGRVDEVAGQSAQVIREGIAAGLTHIVQIGGNEVTGAFQGGNGLVAKVRIVHRVTHRLTGCNAAETILQQIISTEHIIQVGGEVAVEQRAHRAGAVGRGVQVLHDIVGVQVAVHVGLSKQVAVREALAQQVFADVVNHRLEVTQDLVQLAPGGVQVGGAQQVNQVASPAANVGVVLAAIVVVGDVHGAEHVAKVHTVTIRQLEFLQVLQTADHQQLLAFSLFAVELVFLLSNVLGKASILVAGHDTPGTGVVTLNAGTDVLDDQHHRILAGVLAGVLYSPLFQHRQVRHEVFVGGNHRLRQRLDLNLGAVRAAGTGLMGLPANDTVTGLLALDSHNVMAQGRQFDLCNDSTAADLTVRAFGVTGSLTHLGHFFIDHRGMRQLLTLGIATAVGTGGRCGTGRRSHVVLQQIRRGGAAAFTQTGRVALGTRRHIPLMRSGNDLLFHKNRLTDGAVLAFRQAVRRTGLFHSRVDDFGMAGRRDHLRLGHFTALSNTADSLFAGQQAGRGRDDLHILPGMLCGHNFLSDDGLTADLTVAALGQTGFGTGRSDSLVNHRRMSHGDDFLHGRAALLAQTGLGQHAVRGTGGIGGDVTLVPQVIQCRDFFLRDEDLLADGAAHTLGQTGFSTGGQRRQQLFFRVARRGDLHIGRVIAARAGLVGIPTDLLAGHGLCLMINVIMIQRGDFHVSRVITALTGTGFVSIPADLSTGHSLGGMRCLQVALCADLLIGRIVAARTGLVCIPADLFAGRSLSFVLHFIVAQRPDLLVRRVLTTGTGHIGVPADLSTGHGLSVMLHLIVTQRLDLFVRRVIAALTGTLLVSIPTNFGTGRSLSAMVGQQMLQGLPLLVRGVIAAGTGHIGVPTDLFTGRLLCLMGHLIMLERIDLLVRRVVAARAGLIGVPADLSTGRSLRLMRHFVVTQCLDFRIGRVVTTATGHIGVPADLSTGRGLRGVRNLQVAPGIDLLVRRVVAAGTGHIGVPTDLSTGRSLSLMLHFIVAQSLILRIRRVVAARAGLIGIPADLSTGRSLRLVGHLIMTQRRTLVVRRVVTALTGALLVGVPADFRTGRGLFTVRGLLMAQCSLFRIRRVVAARAGLIGIPADFFTGRRLCLMGHLIVAQRGLFDIRRIVAARTGHIGVPADRFTGRRLRLMSHLIVIQRFELHVGRVIATATGLVSIPADLSTGRLLRRMGDRLMAQLRLLTIRGIVAAGTGHIGVPTDLSTGRSLSLMLHFIVAQSLILRIRRVVAARAGLIGVPTDLSTGRSLRLVGHLIMIQRRTLVVRRVVTALTVALLVGVPADFRTGRSLFAVRGLLMAQRSLFRIRRVFAARAGLIGIPADFFTGRRLCLMGHLIMAQRSLFDIRRIVAARTGHIGVPADHFTGRRLRLVSHRVVVQSRDLLVSGMAAVQRTYLVGFPARLGTGCSLTVALRDHVLQLGQLGVRGVTATLTLTGLIGSPADLITGGSLALMLLDVVLLRGNDVLRLRAVGAARAGHIGIPAFLGTGRRLRLVGHFIVSQLLPHLVGAVATARTLTGLVGIPAVLSTGGSLLVVVHDHVLQGRTLVLLQGAVGAARAGLVSIPALNSASRLLRLVEHLVMRQRRDLHIGGVIAARALVVGLPTSLSTGRCLCLMRHNVVIQCRDLNKGRVVTAATGLIGLIARRGTGGLLLGALDELVSKFIALFVGRVITTIPFTGLVGIPALFGTGRLLPLIILKIMVLGIRAQRNLILVFRIILANIRQDATLRTGRNRSDCASVPIMSLFVNLHRLSLDVRVVVHTGEGLHAFLAAGRRRGDLALIPGMGLVVNLHRLRLGVRVVVHTGEGLHAFLAAGRRRGDLTLVPGMGLVVNLHRRRLGVLAVVRTGKGLHAFLATGCRRGDLAVIPSMCVYVDFNYNGRSMLIVVLTSLRQDARCHTGCRRGDLALVPGVIQRRQFLVSGIVTAFTATGLVSIPADLSTGGRLCLVIHIVVVKGVLLAVFRMGTGNAINLTVALVGAQALFCTGRLLDPIFGRNHVMAQCFNLSITGHIVAAFTDTMATSRLTGIGAGRRLLVVVHEVMTQLISIAHLGRITTLAITVPGLLARLSTGRSLALYVVASLPVVIQRLQLIVGRVGTALTLTGIVSIPADLSAGGRLGIRMLEVVVVGIDRHDFSAGVLTIVFTGVSLLALSNTGRLVTLQNHTFAPLMGILINRDVLRALMLRIVHTGVSHNTLGGTGGISRLLAFFTPLMGIGNDIKDLRISVILVVLTGVSPHAGGGTGGRSCLLTLIPLVGICLNGDVLGLGVGVIQRTGVQHGAHFSTGGFLFGHTLIPCMGIRINGNDFRPYRRTIETNVCHRAGADASCLIASTNGARVPIMSIRIILVNRNILGIGMALVVATSVGHDTGLCTCGLLSNRAHILVTKRRNDLVSRVIAIIVIAVHVVLIASHLTGGCFTLHFNNVVLAHFALSRATTFTLAGLGLSTGRGLPQMAELLTFSSTAICVLTGLGLSTGRILPVVGPFFASRRRTILTSSGLLAGCLRIVVLQHRLFLTLGGVITARALLVCVPTNLRTGSFLSSNSGTQVVIQRSNLFRLCVVTIGTGTLEGLGSLLGTGRLITRKDRALVHGMAQRIDSNRGGRIAACTGHSVNTGSFTGGQLRVHHRLGGVLEVVVQRIGIVVLIGVLTILVRAGMLRITPFSTGGLVSYGLVIMRADSTFSSATNRTSLGRGTGCILPLVTQRSTFSSATNRTSLGRGTGCILPLVTRGFAFRCATNRTSLRLNTGGILVLVRQRFLLDLCVQVAAGTSLVGLPADFRTGRGLRVMINVIMAQCINGTRLRHGTTGLLTTHGLLTVSGTGSRLYYIVLRLIEDMLQRIQNGGLGLRAANTLVGLRTRDSALGLDRLHKLGDVVAQRVVTLAGQRLSFAVATAATGMGNKRRDFASCVGFYACVVMAQRLAFGHLTNRTGLSRVTVRVLPAVALGCTFGRLTNLTGLRRGTGGVLPGMAQGLAPGRAALVRTGFGFSTGGSSKHMLQLRKNFLALGCMAKLTFRVGRSAFRLTGCRHFIVGNRPLVLQCGDLFRLDIAAVSTGGGLHTGLFALGGGGNRAGAVAMAGGGNGFFCGCITAITLTGLGQDAVGGTGGSNGHLACIPAMTQRLTLRFGLRVATAVLTGRGNRRRSITGCVDGFCYYVFVLQLSLFNLSVQVAAGTSLVGIPTGRKTGRGLSRMIDVVMAQCVLFNLSVQFTTRTGLIGIPADFRTGRGLSRMADFVVAQCRLFGIGGVVTTGTVLVGIPADFRTGRSLRTDRRAEIMAQLVNRFRVGIATGFTSVRCVALLSTGGVGYNALVAMVDHGDVLGRRIVTADTLVGGSTQLRTSGSLGLLHENRVVVAQRLIGFLGKNHMAAAAHNLLVAGLSTGGGLLDGGGVHVTGGGNHFRLGLTAASALTGVGLYAILFTLGSGGHLAGVPVMAQRVNVGIDNVNAAAVGADMRGVALRLTGGGRHGRSGVVVAQLCLGNLVAVASRTLVQVVAVGLTGGGYRTSSVMHSGRTLPQFVVRIVGVSDIHFRMQTGIDSGAVSIGQMCRNNIDRPLIARFRIGSLHNLICLSFGKCVDNYNTSAFAGNRHNIFSCINITFSGVNRTINHNGRIICIS